MVGDRLIDAGIRTFVMGTSDTDQLHRFAPFLTMTSKGMTEGSFKASVMKDITRAYGVKMNTERMLDEIAKRSEVSSLIVVEWGDLYRLFTLKIK